MIQSRGMVLEGRMAVGHGGMAGVAGFREQAEVREAQTADQGNTGAALLGATPLLASGVQEQTEEQG